MGKKDKQFPGDFPFDDMDDCISEMEGEVDDPGAFCSSWYMDTFGEHPRESNLGGDTIMSIEKKLDELLEILKVRQQAHLQSISEKEETAWKEMSDAVKSLTTDGKDYADDEDKAIQTKQPIPGFSEQLEGLTDEEVETIFGQIRGLWSQIEPMPIWENLGFSLIQSMRARDIAPDADDPFVIAVDELDLE